MIMPSFQMPMGKDNINLRELKFKMMRVARARPPLTRCIEESRTELVPTLAAVKRPGEEQHTGGDRGGYELHQMHHFGGGLPPLLGIVVVWYLARSRLTRGRKWLPLPVSHVYDCALGSRVRIIDL